MTGVMWALAMAAMFGFSQLSSRKGLTGISVDQGTFIMVVVSVLLMVIPFFWLSGPELVSQSNAVSLVYFMLAGIIHFVGGFTAMNKSISTIGAARTGSLIATTPLFATFIAAFTLRELLNAPMVAGVIIVIAGVLLISSSRLQGSERAAPQRSSSALGIVSPLAQLNFGRESLYGLAAAASWGFTPVLIKKGLLGLDSPLVGLTLAMATAGLIYAVILGMRGRLRPLFSQLGKGPAYWQAAAGALVGLGTLFRWIALSYTTAAVVTTLSRFSLLITVGLGGVLLGRELEPITPRVRWGALSIFIGSVLVVLYGRP